LRVADRRAATSYCSLFNNLVVAQREDPCKPGYFSFRVSKSGNGIIAGYHYVKPGEDVSTVCNIIRSWPDITGTRVGISIFIDERKSECALREAMNSLVDAIRKSIDIARCVKVHNMDISVILPIGSGFLLLLNGRVKRRKQEVVGSVLVSMQLHAYRKEDVYRNIRDIDGVTNIACSFVEPVMRITYQLENGQIWLVFKALCHSSNVELGNIPIHLSRVRGSDVPEVLSSMLRRIEALAELVTSIDLARLYISFLNAISEAINVKEIEAKTRRSRFVFSFYTRGKKNVKGLSKFLENNMVTIFGLVPKIVNLSKSWVVDIESVRASEFFDITSMTSRKVYTTYGYVGSVFRNGRLVPTRLIVRELTYFRPASIGKYDNRDIYVIDETTLRRDREKSSLELKVGIQWGVFQHEEHVGVSISTPINVDNLADLIETSKPIYISLAIALKVRMSQILNYLVYRFSKGFSRYLLTEGMPSHVIFKVLDDAVNLYGLGAVTNVVSLVD